MRFERVTREAMTPECRSQPVHSPWPGYGIAIVSVAIMAAIRFSLNRWLEEEQSRFILFLPAIMVASWYGGMRSAMLALGLGAGVGAYFSEAWKHPTPTPHFEDSLALALYVMAGLMIALVNEMQRQAKQRAENSRLSAERAQALLEERNVEIEHLNEQLQRAMTETYHRVKNNLQVISALIGLQIPEGDADVPASELQRLNLHVQALAAINDLLTQQSRHDGQVSHLPFSSTFDKLISLIATTIGDRPLHCNVEPIPLTIKQGTALAMLVNELISNAVKHGAGPIDVTFSRSGNMARLEVCDDGPGFPQGFNAAIAANTGLDLVENLSRWDLNGTVSYGNRATGGGRIVVIFPIAEVEEKVCSGLPGNEAADGRGRGMSNGLAV